MKLKFLFAAVAASLLSATGCSSSSSSGTVAVVHDLARMQMVLATNADIAHKAYSDAVTTATALQAAIAQLEIDAGDGVTENELQAVKDAWLVAREPYLQTEVYRFRQSPIDNDPTVSGDDDGPEGAITAWPLGEALIDYVQTNNSDFDSAQIGTDHQVSGVTDPLDATAAVDQTDNIIGNASIDLDPLTATLLDSSEAGDGADVIAGYHAIEFILWGQDLKDAQALTIGNDRDLAVKVQDASSYAVGGDRPVTDFDLQNNGTCTTGSAHTTGSDVPCQRRHDFLQLVVEQLVADLSDVRDHWVPTTGAYRTAFTSVADVNAAKARLLEIVTGMGTLAVGELAGERMQIAFAGNSQEDEHSCFSDNTHRDIVLDALGVANAYYGDYAGYDSTLDGTVDVTTNAVIGYGLDDYLADLGLATLADDIVASLNNVRDNAEDVDDMARAGMPVDVQIMTPISSSDAMAQTILALNALGSELASLVSDLALGATGIDDFEDTDCNTSDPTSTC